MTESGCLECGANTYSSDAATECTPCPVNKVSAAGSKSDADCRHGLYLVYYVNIAYKISKYQYLKLFKISNEFVNKIINYSF